ncbi:MAG TPA: DUF1223 domain-containing protein [Bryobacteraceae bacterium]|nr:DUF1223 domain-containing protein [Bryobacteraceae bacterium]
MRYLAIFALLGLASAQDRRVPVIVELFTSEGCSSCPPADQLLSRMDRDQPIAGARVIALEEHVDYWNSLGWVDPFSSAQYRGRQNDYGRKFFDDNIYTPQMVVNGQVAFVGNDGNRAAQEIAKAEQAQTTILALKATPKPGEADVVELSVQVTNNGKIRNSNVFLAVTESDLSTNVSRGENSGRLLRHGPVVRSFGVIGKLDAKGSNAGAITNTLRLPREWKRENLRAVVFVQERESYKITGAGVADLR